MKDNIVIHSKNHNAYPYNREKKILTFIHPLMEKMLYNEDDADPDEKEYYSQKINYLKKHLGEINKEVGPPEFLSSIFPETIRQQVINLNQLTLEVTEDCNLNCKYCGYGEYYCDYEKRERRYMSFDTFRNVFEYLEENWREYAHSINTVYISFYGGEPLLNIEFIKKVVSYIQAKNIPYRNFKFNMTTNGILLNRHIEFFVKNQFHILVSIDGNLENNSYRLLQNNKPSFEILYKKLKTIREKYPSYFLSNIEFMTVLHNRNSYDDVIRYLKNEFGKVPNYSPLSTNGVNQSKIEEFEKMLNKSTEQSFKCLNNKEKEELATKHPENASTTNYIKKLSGNVFHTYSDLFINKNNLKYFPTGTCLPFGKRMFIAANENILPCERIGHRFSLGRLHANAIEIDYDKISEQYSEYYTKIIKQCANCYQAKHCTQCIFNFKNFEKAPICNKVMDYANYKNDMKNIVSLLEENININKILSEWI